jgi:hypothetical protein
VHRALYPLRLGVVESNNVTRSNITGGDLLYRHVPTEGGCRMTCTRLSAALLSVTDDPAAALRYPSRSIPDFGTQAQMDL